MRALNLYDASDIEPTLFRIRRTAVRIPASEVRPKRHFVIRVIVVGHGSVMRSLNLVPRVSSTGSCAFGEDAELSAL
jgi:hypothetical protein